MSDNYRRLNSLLAPAVRPTGRQEVQQPAGRHTELRKVADLFLDKYPSSSYISGFILLYFVEDIIIQFINQ